MKILITDALSENGLNLLREAEFEVIYKINPQKDELTSLVSDIDGWIVRSGTKILKENFQDAKKLQVIGRAGVGIDNIDLDAATSHGVVVMNVPDGNTISAAEHTMAMLMALSRNITQGHLGLLNGEWNRNNLVGNELQRKTIGVVGLGKIGREVIKRSLSYDMKILGYDPFVNKDQFKNKEIEIVDLDTLTEKSDYITLHLPLNENTRNLFDYSRLSKMKKSSRIINVARGGIINEDDLSKALNNKMIAGAAIDVFANEPLDPNSNLISSENILLTPHLGASTFEAKEGVTMSVCNQLIDYFNDGKLKNAINIPIADTGLMKKLSPYYKLSELIGSAQSQLASDGILSVDVICYGTAEDSKSISLAFLKGLLSKITDNRINFINAASIAKERGIKFSHKYSNDDIPYSNVIETIVETENDCISILGSVYNEDQIRIINIMGFDVDLRPKGNMLFIKNEDVPGVVGKVGTIIGKNNVNISGFLLSNMKDKNFAYSVIKIENNIKAEIIEEICNLDEVIEVKQLHL